MTVKEDLCALNLRKADKLGLVSNEGLNEEKNLK
jgi:hypothetical protein